MTGIARTLVAAVAALVAVAGVLVPRAPRTRPAEPRVSLAPPGPEPGFARALEARAFALPRDHGPHLEYQTEWWYYTGHLATAEGRRFAFQVTFFRRGLAPGAPGEDASARGAPRAEPPAGGDAFGLATSQVYFAHFALVDVEGGSHRGVERFARGAGGLAGAQGEPFRVWLEDWHAEALSEDGSSVHLVARDGDTQLDLVLEAGKPLATHGDRGLSAKSDEPGNASYYVGYTRMDASGRISLHDAALAVEGTAWFDHEWSTSALGPRALGWDWFSLQLDDGCELMYFQIRRDDGGIEPVSGGSLVEEDGTVRHLPADAVRLQVLERWTSPRTKAVYPVRWRLASPELGLDLEIEPLLADQEMTVSVVYWEGAVDVRGTARRKPVAGRGFVEMTGYARGVAGLF
jgi:predicted secreted hydrolase